MLKESIYRRVIRFLQSVRKLFGDSRSNAQLVNKQLLVVNDSVYKVMA
jgi:hypothetical protein